MISPKYLASNANAVARSAARWRHRYLGGCPASPATPSTPQLLRTGARRDFRGFVLATVLLGHIRRLRKAGIGYRAIAAAADLTKSTMQKIISRKQRQFRKHDADRILAVDRTAVADLALVPAGPIWRLLNELLAAGFSKMMPTGPGETVEVHTAGKT